MINKDSIVTAYDEHLTLVEWLQKVENALNNAVLTNLGIAKLSDQGNIATYQVTATFADNATIVSDTFTLPSTDIVTAFRNLTTLVNGFDTRITANTNNVASILQNIDIDNAKINPDTLQNSINGSDDVIVDIDNDKLEIHLSDELQAKLARVLLLPSSAPSTRKVVTIDTNGEQDNIDGTELTTLMSNIVDSHGNKRFVEFNGDANSIEGVTITYNKASLSGSHLMVVLAGSIANGTTIDNSKVLAFYNIPAYIMNKIIPVWGSNIEVKNVSAFAEDWTSQSFQCVLAKNISTQLGIFKAGSTTFTAGRKFRIQFDLLIDSD